MQRLCLNFDRPLFPRSPWILLHGVISMDTSDTFNKLDSVDSLDALDTMDTMDTLRTPRYREYSRYSTCNDPLRSYSFPQRHTHWCKQFGLMRRKPLENRSPGQILI